MPLFPINYLLAYYCVLERYRNHRIPQDYLHLIFYGITVITQIVFNCAYTHALISHICHELKIPSISTLQLMLMCTLIAPLQITPTVILQLIDLRINSNPFLGNINGNNMNLTTLRSLKVHWNASLRVIHGILKSRGHLKTLGCNTKLTSSEKCNNSFAADYIKVGVALVPQTTRIHYS